MVDTKQDTGVDIERANGLSEYHRQQSGVLENVALRAWPKFSKKARKYKHKSSACVPIFVVVSYFLCHRHLTLRSLPKFKCKYLSDRAVFIQL